MKRKTLDFLRYHLRERLSVYRKEVYLECIYLDSLLFFSILFFLVEIFFSTEIIRPNLSFLLFLLSFIVSMVAFIIKTFSRDNTRKFFIIYLWKEFYREKVYILFFWVNIFFFVSVFILTSWAPYFTGLFVVPVLRLLFLGEDILVQNRLLRAAIKETQSYEELTVFSPMVKTSSYDALMDLTRIKDQMYRSAQASVQSQQMKTELITNISHDLKTPLTSIINYADILSKKSEMDEEAQTYIRILGRNSERLKSLIINLIDASKTGSGNVKLEPAIIEFNELISQIYGDFDNDYQKKGLEFIYETEEENTPIYTDGNVLSRVIQNLFSNVCKYSLENTRVYGKTHITENKIYFNIRNVSKNPIDVSIEELQSQFIRGEKSRTAEGSGLGLYIAKNLVEILQGEFRIIVDGDYFQVFIELPKEMK